VLESSPLPFAALMLLGFLIGAAGHLYKSPPLIVTGIGLIVLAVVLAQIDADVGD
jgi:hypothetical protein